MQAGRRRPQRAAAQRNSKADFSKCDQPTLNEYIKHNKLEVNVGASREEVVDAVSKHFISMAPPTEEDAIAAFLLALKKKKEGSGPKRQRPGGRR